MTIRRRDELMPWPSNKPDDEPRGATNRQAHASDDPWPAALDAAEKSLFGPLALAFSNRDNLETLPPHLARLAFVLGYGGLTTRGKYHFVMRDYDSLMASKKLTRDQATEKVIAAWSPEPVKSIVTRSKRAKVSGSANVADLRRAEIGQTSPPAPRRP